MTLLRCWLTLAISVCLVVPVVAYSAPGDIDQEYNEDGMVEEPSFSNPAQAMHAANLAEAAAIAPDPDTVEAVQGVIDAEKELADAQESGTATEEELLALEKAVEDANEVLAGEIAELSGVYREEVREMRQERMGWGQIAHELGVHPGALGLGHGKQKGIIDPEDLDDELIDPDDEIAEVTQRDNKTGWSKDHGFNASGKKNSQKGLGLSETSVASGSSVSGNKGGKDKSGNPGNSAKTSSSGSSHGNSGKSRDKSDNGKAKGKSKD